ncbi:hypothetical protein PUR57_17635 [Streptomyces sp. JV176]|uniref:hypothetical protein n=1 Tax=Streptomyces sp. JV176 TaxID=858630 RepID=UPI002E75AAE5|nr:hypothetical protein [Streptomyces sp. JV176]MEE1800469.1 hypothetical protein [Streptomyces sp. JV176]
MASKDEHSKDEPSEQDPLQAESLKATESLKDGSSAEDWPLPPSWMWGCTECTVLYKAMKRAPEVVDAARVAGDPGIDYDPMDTVVTTQIRLARHIATDHAEDVPAVDESCDRCVSDVKAKHFPAVLMLEHRARHLFAPPSIAGLI